MGNLSRRQFLRRTVLASAAGAAVLSGISNRTQASAKPMATVIDLSRCDGCAGLVVPQCVAACKNKNQSQFPQPVKPIQDYWPRKGYEDWSDKQQLTNRLTPYNWLYVQTVTVNGSQISIPRRCMHCENPPCAKICPFSAYTIHGDSSVVVDHDVCFGGAKCRDVCPWGVPSRQAGVGLYMKLAPTYGGGGVMYKCDMCHDLVAKGQQPACVATCPKQAMTFGPKVDMKQMAEKRRQEIGGFTYGLKENGGTATYYVSPVSFADIDKALHAQGTVDGKPGRAGMPAVSSKMEEFDTLAAAMLVAPVAGMFAAGRAALRSMKQDDKE